MRLDRSTTQPAHICALSTESTLCSPRVESRRENHGTMVFSALWRGMFIYLYFCLLFSTREHVTHCLVSICFPGRQCLSFPLCVGSVARQGFAKVLYLALGFLISTNPEVPRGPVGRKGCSFGSVRFRSITFRKSYQGCIECILSEKLGWRGIAICNTT